MNNEQEFEKKLSNLGERIDELTQQSKDSFQKETENLKHGWELLEARRKKIVSETHEKWQDVKEGMEEGFDNVQKMYEDLKRKVKG